eukprot:TRINITY_DN2193_c0_g3_i2.p1 TRINITY_DN2193_c0_g3~~TRINITY_DN2193_c0_g3_i2.p1  ORF type:complete len:143 (+),score=27.19 TRINITY_DN2193_c0_g3_i2:26-454(+)
MWRNYALGATCASMVGVYCAYRYFTSTTINRREKEDDDDQVVQQTHSRHDDITNLPDTYENALMNAIDRSIVDEQNRLFKQSEAIDRLQIQSRIDEELRLQQNAQQDAQLIQDHINQLIQLSHSFKDDDALGGTFTYKLKYY